MEEVYRLLLEKHLVGDAYNVLSLLKKREIVPFTSDEIATFFQTMIEQLVFLYPEEEAQFEDNEDWMELERDEHDERRERLFFDNYIHFVYNVYQNLYKLIITFPKLFQAMAYVNMVQFYGFCLSMDRNVANKCTRADWKQNFNNLFEGIKYMKASCFMAIVQLLPHPIVTDHSNMCKATDVKIVSYFKKHCRVESGTEDRLNSNEHLKTLKRYFPTAKKYKDIKFFV